MKLNKKKITAIIICIIITIAISVLLVFFMHRAIDYSKHEQNEDINALLVEIIDSELDAIDSMINDNELSIEEATNRLIPFVNNLDAHYNVFAALYDKDLNTLSYRHGDLTFDRTVLLTPLENQVVLNTILNRNTGMVDIKFIAIYKNGSEIMHDTHIYFRRVTFDDNYLIVVGGVPFIEDLVEVNPRFYMSIYVIFIFVGLGLSFLIATFIRYSDSFLLEPRRDEKK